MPKSAVLLLAAGLAAPCALWSADTGPLPSTLRVTGEAQVSVKPTQARLQVGVVKEAPTAQGAASQNAKAAEAVVAELKKTLGPGAEIKTLNYSINPVYGDYQGSQGPVIKGYSAANVVQVVTEDLGKVGKAIDTALMAGANQVQSLVFSLKDDETPRQEALIAAVRKARKKADAMAQGLGLKVVKVLSVEEESAGAPFPRVMALERSRGLDAATPIETGDVDVRAAVVLTVEVGP